MTAAAWEKVAAATGIAFIALLIASMALVGQVETAENQPPQVVAERIADNETAVATGSFLLLLAAASLAWFAGSVRAHLRRTEAAPGRLSAVSFGGGAISAAILAVTAGATFAATELADPAVTNPSGAATAFTIAGSLLFGPATVGIAVMVVAASLLAARHRALPRWLAPLGVVGGAAAVVPLWPVFPIGALLVLVWIAATSITLIAGAGEPV